MRYALLFLWINFFNPTAAHALTAQVLVDTKQSAPLNFAVLEDTTGQLTITDVSQAALAHKFIQAINSEVNYSYTSSAYWLKFTLNNQSVAPMPWYLYFKFANIQHIDFCQPNNTGFTCQRTGTYYPLSSRDMPYPNFIFHLPISSKETKTFYMRVASQSVVLINLEIYSANELMQKNALQQLILGGIIGYLLLVSFYNLFLWNIFKENSYLYYIAFNISYLYFLIAYTGLASVYLWQTLPIFNSFSVPISALFILAAIIKFSIEFLHSKQKTPLFHKIITSQLFILIALFVYFILSNNYRVTILSVGIMVVVTSISVLTMSVQAWRTGYKPARYFILAWLCPLINATLSAAIRFNFIESEFFNKIIANININFMVFMSLSTFLSFALADRIASIKQEREKALNDNIALVHLQNITLENQVKQRTIELELAKEKAEAANRAKSSFIANMSHELRSPLNAVLGFSQIMLRTKNLPLAHYENASIIYRSGDYLLNLINNILDFSKLEASKTTLNLVCIDFYQLLDDLEDILHLRANNKNISLGFIRANELPRYIQTDSIKLQQILLNLLGNAIKFTHHGEVVLTIKAIYGENDAIILNFNITDTGVGIAEHELKQLFTAFSQTSSGREAQEGTGLGLVISRQFVQLMGGDIAVQSLLGKGTTFSFNLHVSASDPVIPSDEAIDNRRVIALAPNQAIYKLLIVDDKEINRQLLVQLLKPLGFYLKEAANGQEAVAIWELWQPALCWMDMRMPVMDGYEATRRIKAHVKGSATAVIALTASVLEEEKAIVLSAGCDDFIRKPFKENIIFETLHKHLGVQFIYEQTATDYKPLEINLKGEQLAHLEKQWLGQFYEVVLEADNERAVLLIKQLPASEQALKNQLTTLIHQFQFEKIMNALETLSET